MIIETCNLDLASLEDWISDSPVPRDSSLDLNLCRLEPALASRMIRADYQSGIGPRPCPDREKTIKRITRWLAYELINRLGNDCVRISPSLRRDIGTLAASDLSDQSIPEIRTLVGKILRKHRFPEISAAFVAHNHLVNEFCCDSLASTPLSGPSLAGWLMLLAAANYFEVWPGTPLPEATEFCRWTQLASRSASKSFDELARLVATRLDSAESIGLFTDNCGEVSIDLDFLFWMQRCYAKRFYIFPKGCPIETDVDHAAVLGLVRRFHPNLKANIITGGSHVQGNLLPTLSVSFAKQLLDLQSRHGFLFVKGLANLATMPGILLDALFLFVVKSKTFAGAIGRDVGTICGLYLPAGSRIDDPGSFLASCSSIPAPIQPVNTV